MQHEKVRVTPRRSTEDYSVSSRTVLCPVRCPACGKLKQVPDRYDLEQQMERDFLKCLASSDPACKTATASPSVQVLKDRLTSS